MMQLDSQFILFHGDKIDMEPKPIERLLNVILSELPRPSTSVVYSSKFVFLIELNC